MGAGIAVLVMVAAAAGFVWLIQGPVGQRGRAVRRDRNGKPNAPFVASMIAIVVIVVVLVAKNH